MDAITAPVSLYEPVYSEGGDALTVMDQVRDRKNTDEQWIESITLRAGDRRTLASAKSAFWPCALRTGARRWRSPGRSASRRRRCRGWRKAPSARIRKAILPS